MKKLLYIGHTYHKKTKSTRFLIDLLSKDYLVSEIYFDPREETDYTAFDTYKGAHFDAIVIFQIMPEIKELRKYITWRHGVFFPMYDHYMGGTPFDDPIWHEYVSFTVINFSKTLHNKLTACGFDSHYVQFFPAPAAKIEAWGKPDSAFFWQRITPLNLQLIGQVLSSFKLSAMHIHKALDPAHVFTPVSECSSDVQEFFKSVTMTESSWFPGKEDMLKIMQKSALYIAPRYYEGIGMSFLEAMASGRCVVAPDCPTINEYIKDGENGLLYAWDDPDAKVQAKSADEIKKIQRNAYDFICNGYKKWTQDKSDIIKWVAGDLHADFDKEMQSAKENGWIDYPIEEQPRPNVKELLSEMIIKRPLHDSSVKGKKPDVSVVTIVFNAIKGGRKKWLIQSLDSVQAQTGINVEHVIIDGGSKDGTLELLLEYQNKNVPMRILSKPDKGIYYAMNRGLWLAEGDYVIFLNSDDFYHNKRGLYESYRRLEETQCDFSYAPVIVLDEKTDMPIFDLQSSPDVTTTFVQMSFSHQSVMYRRKSFLAIHGYNIVYRSAADYDSILRMILQGYRGCCVKEYFVSYRMGGVSDKFEQYSQRETGKIYSALFDRFPGIKITPEEGRNIFVSKLYSHELKKAQRPFLLASFPEMAEEKYDFKSNFMKCQKEYESFKSCLKTFKILKSPVAACKTFIKLALPHPRLFCKYCYFFLQNRKTSSSVEAGKKTLSLLLNDFFICRKNDTSSSAEQASETVIYPCMFANVSNVYALEGDASWASKDLWFDVDLPDHDRGQTLRMTLNTGAFLLPQSPRRVVDVIVNGVRISSFEITTSEFKDYEFTLPPSVTAASHLEILFAADKDFSPAELGISQDKRRLAFRIKSLSISRGNHNMKSKKRKIGILYDVTIFVHGTYSDYRRSGIFFTAYNIYTALKNRKDVHLSYYCDPAQIETVKNFFQQQHDEEGYNALCGKKPLPPPQIENLTNCILQFYKLQDSLGNYFLKQFCRLSRLFLKIIRKLYVRKQQIEENEQMGIDYFISPVFAVPEKFSDIPHSVVLYDAIPLKFPQFFPVKPDWYYDILKTISENSTFFMISEATKQDFLELFPALRADNVTVIPLAADSTTFYQECNEDRIREVREKYQIPKGKPYLFSLCSLEPRKNLERTVRSFISFCRKHPDSDIIYVMGGSKWSNFSCELDEEGLAIFKQKIYPIGYVADEDLAALFSGAYATLYVSLYEGFGLPVLEAMQCGCPVITSNNSSIPEVAGNAALMVDAENEGEIEAAIEKICGQPELRRKMSIRGSLRAKRFSWKACADVIVKTVKKDLAKRR